MARRRDVPCAAGCGAMVWGGRGGGNTTDPASRMCVACRRAAGPTVRRRGREALELRCVVCGVTFARRHRSGYSSDRPCCSRACGGELVRRAALERGGVTSVAARSARRRARFTAALDEHVDRFVVFERDGWTCHLCGRPIDRSLSGRHRWGPTLDHVIPLSLGGRHCYANVRAAHLRCNASRGARPLGRSA